MKVRSYRGSKRRRYVHAERSGGEEWEQLFVRDPEIVLIVRVFTALERVIKNCHAFRALHLACR